MSGGVTPYRQWLMSGGATIALQTVAHVWWVLLFPCRLWFLSGRFYSFPIDLAHVWWRYCCPADSGLFLMDVAVSLQTLGQKAAHGPRGW